MESITTPESEPEKILTWECVHQEEIDRALTDPIFSGLVRPGAIYSSKFCFVGYGCDRGGLHSGVVLPRPLNFFVYRRSFKLIVGT